MIFNIIALACLTIIIATSSITNKIKHYFGVSNLDEPKTVLLQFIQELINCNMCVGFWVGLIATQSILIASVVSILATYIGGKI